MPESWYGLSKREAESAAVEFAKGNGLDLVRICPALVLGPLLQSTANASSLVLVKLIEGTYMRLVNGNYFCQARLCMSMTMSDVHPLCVFFL